ncbi:MAG: hypothetical protein SNJ72_02820 [Fimbriimonadales bacterium]
MKKEIPTWAVVVAIVVVLGLVAAYWWQGTSRNTGDVVVPRSFGDESNPFGSEGRPTPQAGSGTGASGP